MKYSHPLLFILLVLGLLAGCKKKQAAENEVVLRPVRYSQVSLQGGDLQRTFNGTSKSGSETRLSFRSNGLITEIRAKVGDRVRKNQLLGQLDQRDQSLNYEKAKSGVESSRIQLENARSSLNRVKELYQVNSASLSDYEQAKNNYANALNGYQSAQKTLDLQASQFNYGKIIAPTEGIVTQVNAEINEFAQAGNPVFVINAKEGDIEIKVGVPESYISRIQEGSEVQVHFPSLPDKSFKAVITEVGFSTSGTASYPVIVKLTESDPQIRPGMPAEVTFLFKAPKGSTSQLIVDFKAVSEDEAGNFVYKLEQKSEATFTAKKTPLEIGPLTNEGFVVRSGLKEGDRVATAGLRSLFDGMDVTLLED